MAAVAQLNLQVPAPQQLGDPRGVGQHMGHRQVAGGQANLGYRGRWRERGKEGRKGVRKGEGT